MITRDDIQTVLTEMQAPVLSLYLNIDNADQANQAAIPAWQVEIRNRLDALAATLDDPNDALWRQLADQADAYLHQFESGGQSAAVFFDADGLREFRVQFPLETQVSYGPPLVTPLLWLVDEYEPYLIVLIDQEKAHLLRGYLGRVGAEDRLELDIDDYDFQQRSEYQLGAFAQGDFRDLYEKMIDEHRMRYYREVAARIEQLCREKDYQRIILGGAEQSAGALKNLLPARIAEQVVGVLPIPVRSDGRAIMERALPAALDFERAYETALVNEIIDLAKGSGRGALGMDDVRMALEQQRVELIVIPYPIADRALAAELPLRVLESNGQIELVHGEAAERLNAEGGIGARLYYAIPSGGNTVPTEKDSPKSARSEPQSREG